MTSAESELNMAGTHHTIEDITAVLINRGVATPATLVGCSPEEITAFEQDVGQSLPETYRSFLEHMGRNAGNFYVGTNFFYPGILGLTKAARELLAEDEANLTLPDDAIVFSMHQGYQFLFLRANDGNDPSVWHYLEQTGEFTKKAEHLTQFLFDVAHDDW